MIFERCFVKLNTISNATESGWSAIFFGREKFSGIADFLKFWDRLGNYLITEECGSYEENDAERTCFCEIGGETR